MKRGELAGLRALQSERGKSGWEARGNEGGRENREKGEGKGGREGKGGMEGGREREKCARGRKEQRHF